MPTFYSEICNSKDEIVFHTLKVEFCKIFLNQKTCSSGIHFCISGRIFSYYNKGMEIYAIIEDTTKLFYKIYEQ
jgi:hypothetical protein